MTGHKYYEWVFRRFTIKTEVLSVWHFKMRGLDPWDLLAGTPIDIWSDRNYVLCRKNGIREDFILSNHPIPVHSTRLKEFIEKIAPGEVQYLPIRICNYRGRMEEIEGYHAGNTLRIVDCIDRRQTPAIPEIGNRTRGMYRNPGEKVNVVLNPALTGDEKIFRINGWESMLIVREDVVKAIKKAGFTAGRFTKMKMTDPMMPEKPDETGTGIRLQKNGRDACSCEICSGKLHASDLKPAHAHPDRAGNRPDEASGPDKRGGPGRELSQSLSSEMESILSGLKQKYMPGTELPVPNLDKMTSHIARYIGPPDTVIHEIVSDIVHIDIHCVMPGKGRNFITLVTSGMSDKSMITPDEAREFRYAELLTYLPPDWPLDRESNRREEFYWPVRLLKDLAKLPHLLETWFGLGHTIANGEPLEPFAANTRLCGSLLLDPIFEQKEFRHLTVSPEKTINYLLVFPIYREEMLTAINFGTDMLVERLEMKRISPILNTARKNVFRPRRRQAD
ncbi:MAG: suppressor of fused domain protein [Candidatus Xenobiia bacterium LiM19]